MDRYIGSLFRADEPATVILILECILSCVEKNDVQNAVCIQLHQQRYPALPLAASLVYFSEGTAHGQKHPYRHQFFCSHTTLPTSGAVLSPLAHVLQIHDQIH